MVRSLVSHLQFVTVLHTLLAQVVITNVKYNMKLLPKSRCNTNEAPPQTDEIYATQKLDSIASCFGPIAKLVGQAAFNWR